MIGTQVNIMAKDEQVQNKELKSDQENLEPKHIVMKAKDGLVKSINGFLKDLLTKTDIAGVLAPLELPTGLGYVPSLITDVESLDYANALAPTMAVNASKAVSEYTRLKPSDEKVAVVLRPCELRALIELMKLKQAYFDNLVIIGIDCPGTFSIQDFAEAGGKGKNGLNTEALIKCMTKLEDHKGLRNACQVCEHFTPINTDISIGLFGLDINKEFLLGINTSSAITLLEPLELKSGGDAKGAKNRRDTAVSKLRKVRMKNTDKLETETHTRINGLDNFMTEFSACINCHNCMEVCPICYCRECFFDSPTFNLESDKYFKMANRKGALRLPANMFLFHVTRFNHMVLSCVACGMCEQGCPANIKLLSIYKTVGKRAQKIFDYEPGRSLDEEIPILTFEEDELEPK